MAPFFKPFFLLLLLLPLLLASSVIATFPLPRKGASFGHFPGGVSRGNGGPFFHGKFGDGFEGELPSISGSMNNAETESVSTDNEEEEEKGGYEEGLYETEYMGLWSIDDKNVGVAAMQLQLMPNNKVVWFDTTSLGDSGRKLEPPGNCPISIDQGNKPDCFAHAVEYDVETGESRSIYVDGDPWCSSGNLLPNGDLIATGGTKSGFRSVRLLSKDQPNANFIERKNSLADNRWYSSNQVLEDGSSLVLGGRDSYSYEIIPPVLVAPQLNFQPKRFDLPFLQQTTAPKINNAYIENNLYPFIFLMPDGNVFLFANNKAISFEPFTGKVVREYPQLEGGSRNYPPSGMSALLPLKLTPDNSKPVSAEVVVCGGNTPDAYPAVDFKHTKDKIYKPALQDCHRLKITEQDSTWEQEQDMPSPRTMGDLLHLPTGDLLMLNGAKKGTSGWEDAIDANLTPVLYRPSKPMGKRFKELKPTQISRMYHSCSALLPDGKILVAGSNPHQFYTYNVAYPTELRVEKFAPHYLDPKLNNHRPVIVPEATDKVLKYGQELKVAFTLGMQQNLVVDDVKVTMLAPPFTTHGFSQNQRLIVLGVKSVVDNVITAVAPPSGKIAPPGYYILFVNNRGVPGKGIWVHIE